MKEEPLKFPGTVSLYSNFVKMWFWAPVLKLEKFYSCIIENEKKEYALEQLYRVPLLTFCVNEHVRDFHIALYPSPNLIKYFLSFQTTIVI